MRGTTNRDDTVKALKGDAKDMKNDIKADAKAMKNDVKQDAKNMKNDVKDRHQHHRHDHYDDIHKKKSEKPVVTPVFFSKFNKNSKDLLKESDYDLKRTYSFKTTNNTGLEVTATGELSEDSLKSKGKLKGVYKDKEYGELSLEFDTADLVEAQYTTKELFKGFKAVVNTKADKVNEGQKCNLYVEGQYTKDNFAGTLKLDLVKPPSDNDEELEVTGTAAFAFDKLWLGGNLKYAKNDLSDYDAGVRYNFSDANIVLQSAKKFHTYSLAYWQKVRPALDIGIHFDLDVKKEKDKDHVVFEKTAAFGFDHGIDDNSKMKVMLSKPQGKNLMFSGLYSAKLGDYSKLSLSTVVDVQQFKGGNHKFGIKIENGNI